MFGQFSAGKRWIACFRRDEEVELKFLGYNKASPTYGYKLTDRSSGNVFVLAASCLWENKCMPYELSEHICNSSSEIFLCFGLSLNRDLSL